MLAAIATPAAAQQRPLVTEDPEPIGAGRLLIEGGLEFAADQKYPVSGLEGDLWRIPTLGFSFGLSAIAEFQVDGALYNRLSIDSRNPNAPLAYLLDVDGDTTGDIQDIVVATKIRLLSERANRPSFALRFATKLPTASNEDGLGLDTTDFFASVLGAKTVQSIRIVGNIGLGILADPTEGNRQNDVLTYGASVARALTDRAEVVGGSERPRVDAQRRSLSRDGEPGHAHNRHALHARIDPVRRRPADWPDVVGPRHRHHGRHHIRVQRFFAAVRGVQVMISTAERLQKCGTEVSFREL